MVPITSIVDARLSDASPGDLFLSLTPAGEKFLVGTVNGMHVGLMIEGERPFLFSKLDTWSRRGLIIRNTRFVVDVDSAVRNRGFEAGALHLVEGLPCIAAKTDTHSQHFVVIGDAQAQPAEDAAQFPRWKILVDGEGDELVGLFSFGQPLV